MFAIQRGITFHRLNSSLILNLDATASIQSMQFEIVPGIEFIWKFPCSDDFFKISTLYIAPVTDDIIAEFTR